MAQELAGRRKREEDVTLPDVMVRALDDCSTAVAQLSLPRKRRMLHLEEITCVNSNARKTGYSQIDEAQQLHVLSDANVRGQYERGEGGGKRRSCRVGEEPNDRH